MSEEDAVIAEILARFGIVETIPEVNQEAPDIDGFLKYDISSENYRTYCYGDVEYVIDAPVTLYIKSDEKGDSHRIVDVDGVTHCPRRGWVAITWFAPEKNVSF